MRCGVTTSPSRARCVRGAGTRPLNRWHAPSGNRCKMHTLIAMLLAVVAACAVPRPPAPGSPQAQRVGVLTRAPAPSTPLPPPPHERLDDYILPRLLLPRYPGYDDSPILPPMLTSTDLLNKEIDRINQMEIEELMDSYDADLELIRMYSENVQAAAAADRPRYLKPFVHAMPLEVKPLPEMKREDFNPNPSGKHIGNDARKQFAFTPMDKEYYQPDSSSTQETKQSIKSDGEVIPAESGEPLAEMLLEPPRHIRQNPINLSKQKHLLEPDLRKLNAGLSHEDGEQKQHQIHVLESASDPADSIYGVVLVAAVGAAFAMAILGFAFGWYTLTKKAKAAADVDFPAYGVTGPTVDTSGDRKLAHSAHMYHYQHQKQQIIAMERNGLEQRAGSVSDPESEEENEEGDYTVYECPGFATTGDMEVKNPLFSEEPTPITPGKCEVVKPQPKN